MHQPDVRVKLGREDADFWNTIDTENPDKIILGYDQGLDEAEFLKKFPHIKLDRCPAYQPDFF